MGKVITFIKENKPYFTFECGYANGYVAVPPSNKFYGKHYDEVNKNINVYGGLTYSEFVTWKKNSVGYGSKIKSKYVGKRTPLLDGVEYLTSENIIQMIGSYLDLTPATWATVR